MSRRIDDVNAVVPPYTCRCSRGNRNAALLFLFHPVHNSRSVMHFTDFVGGSCVEQNAFSRSGLTRIDVRHNANISCLIDWNKPRHYIFFNRYISTKEVSPSEVCEGLVSLSHPMRILSLLDRRTPQIRSVK